ncbi:hypothetical protein [Magnetospirillum sp. UT-4]|uniref:hypothetical protein n=1 Tax=Magnetospirillum sp. UT-4 TaxID=2681467 RepID=UPI0020C22BAB|nr:hypothetical protein [Magnetospirillum sp. UT-4]
MSEAPPDLKALARRYLDLWQEQVAAMANDPALAEALARSIALIAQGPAAFVQVAQTGMSSPASEARTPDAASPKRPFPASTGSPAVAAAPDDPCLDAAGLARRLAAVEDRLAALESRLGEGGGKPEGGPRRRRAGRVD